MANGGTSPGIRWTPAGTRLHAVLCSLVLLSACGDGDPSGSPEDKVVRSLDLNVEELSQRGCLNLEATYAAIGDLPSHALVRHHTPDIRIEPTLDEPSEPRRNFLALISFSNFRYLETAARIAHASFAGFEQTDCAFVDVDSGLGAKQRFQIRRNETKSGVHLVAADGSEITYVLKSPRQLEIRRSGEAIDPCPNYAKVKLTSLEVLTWGTQEEFANQPLLASSGLLKRISGAITDMPTHVLTEVMTSDEDYVLADPTDLRGITAGTLDPDVLRCPYRANPPSGEEAPPADESGPQRRPPAPEARAGTSII